MINIICAYFYSNNNNIQCILTTSDDKIIYTYMYKYIKNKKKKGAIWMHIIRGKLFYFYKNNLFHKIHIYVNVYLYMYMFKY